jgi:molybdopterin/thiamine biosynthesis adenylyltransferase
MTWERVEQLIGANNLQRLAEKRVGVVGLGSGGGFVAQSLAMSGVGKFVLVDDDSLEAGNVVRHIADRRDVGRPKTEAVANLIRQRNPDARVETYLGRIEQNLDVLDNLDILIVGVDGEGAKYAINQACLERELPAVYAGVYERGEGGDVVVIRPFNGPCYACWAAELREGLTVGETNQDLDYGMIGPEGTLEAEPGLWLHVVKVATVQADIALNELLADSEMYQSLPANTIIMANRAIEIADGQVSPPHTALWVDIARDPECLVCGQRAQRATVDQGDAAISLDDLASTAGIILEEDDTALADRKNETR